MIDHNVHTKKIIAARRKIEQAQKVLIMVHGRGGNARDILSLSGHLQVNDFALLAPEATSYTWYPFSFLAPPQQNEPWLSSALALLREIINDINANGISSENIYLLGFSQGACLTLEFAARNATRFGGVVAFTGGLIGDKIYADNYKGDFNGTPIFIGTSDPDPHVPVARVNDTVAILKKMNANVAVKIYPNMGHTISKDEIDTVNEIIFTL